MSLQNDDSTYGFETPSRQACKHLWKCCVEHHAFFRMVQVILVYDSIILLIKHFFQRCENRRIIELVLSKFSMTYNYQPLLFALFTGLSWFWRYGSFFFEFSFSIFWSYWKTSHGRSSKCEETTSTGILPLLIFLLLL